MSAHRNAWLDLCSDAVRLGLEAQSVIGLRVAKAAFGGPAAQAEAHLMIAEKTKTAIDAQMLFARSLIAGQAHLAPARALSLYRRRVKANQRRLIRGG
jgi:hypothetical protein